MTSTFDRAFQASLPLPLSRLYVRAFNAKGARERHDHAFHLAETSLKLAAAALIARYRTCGERSASVDAVLWHLAMPSFDQWRDIFRETLLFLGSRAGGDDWSRGILERVTAPGRYLELEQVFATLAESADWRGRSQRSPSVLDVLELLPAYRNAMSDAHGSIKAETSWYEGPTPALLDLVRVPIDRADAMEYNPWR